MQGISFSGPIKKFMRYGSNKDLLRFEAFTCQTKAIIKT